MSERVVPLAHEDKPPAVPANDFAAFGPTESRPLSKVQKVVSRTMVRNWSSIPHVTHHDEADITALEEQRRRDGERLGKRITLLAYLVKAVVRVLAAHPNLNGSLDATGENFIFKSYFNIGIAVETPHGLLVPVIRDADTKGLEQIADEISDVSANARAKGLPLAKMSGGCFTISSLGALGGTGFTPIINAPEVAILGVSRTMQRLAQTDDQIVSRTYLPLSLSYDHRIVNGADAGRFCNDLVRLLSDFSVMS
jgi:pyruvate dehydrogenase E2 component (dihydrolipoamide acetyltransferase)